ncbi:MAG: TolC family protein [Betaproteobacteria bacterium]|nr:TolC family protein [Betaproteobacteria bacterium]
MLSHPSLLPRTCWVWFALVAAIAGPGVYAQDTVPALSYQEVLRLSAQNIDVSLATRNVAAAKSDVLAANRSPLPTLTARASSIDLQNGNGSGSVLQDQRIDKSFGLDWTFERGQKRELRTQTSEKSLAANMAELKAMKVSQQLIAATSFFDLLAAQHKYAEIQAISNSYQELQAIATKRLAAGDISAQDQARIFVEARRAMADTLSVDLERKRASIALANVLGIQTRADQLVLLSDWPPAWDPGTLLSPLQAHGVDQLPEVQAAMDRLSAAEISLQLAQSLKKSDISIGSSVDHYPGTSDRLLEVRMQMPLQWGYGYEGEIARAVAQVEQARDQLEKIRLVLASERMGWTRALETAQQRWTDYDTVIYPQAHQVAQQAELAYQKGAMSLTDLLDARRTLRTILIERLQARADYAKSIAAIQIRYVSDLR